MGDGGDGPKKCASHGCSTKSDLLHRSPECKGGSVHCTPSRHRIGGGRKQLFGHDEKNVRTSTRDGCDRKEGKGLGRPRSGRHTPLAKLIADAVASGRFFYSFEFSAARDPRPDDLYARVDRMSRDLRPLWVDVTWGFGAIGARSIAAARHIQKQTGLPVLMHLICTDMTVADLNAALDAALLAGVRAILVMRGYTQAGYDKWQPCEDGLDHASTLVAHIRKRHGSHFSLGVVAFPETHPESRCKGTTSVATDADRAEDVRRLRRKVDAGADFIICQFTFDLSTWAGFLRQCREAGIGVPILPGVQPLTEYASARLLSKAWAVRLPESIGARLRDFAATDDADGARECGRDFVAALCDAQLRHGVESGEGCGLHFFVYDGEHDVRCLLDMLAQRYGWVCGDKAPVLSMSQQAVVTTSASSSARGLVS